jgi:hypothetical protein
MRRRAFGALREILPSRRAKPLIIYIDDCSGPMPTAFSAGRSFAAPDAPPLLLIASFRSRDIEEQPFLKQMLLQSGTDQCREIQLGPLAAGEAREADSFAFQARRFFERAFIDSIVTEAGSSPFLLEQLTHYGMMNERAAPPVFR